MDADEFRMRGKEMIDFIADYLENVGERRVTPDVEPGYLRSIIPPSAPQTGENWTSIIDDVEKKIMPGITHWQHPRFHAFFPAGNSYPSILGDLLSSGLGIMGFSWASSPACTELETIVLHWLGLMSGLPPALLPFKENLTNSASQNDLRVNEAFFGKDLTNLTSTPPSGGSAELLDSGSLKKESVEKIDVHSGGAVLLGSASECVLVTMLAARAKAIANYKRNVGIEENGAILSRLVAYASELSHSCVEKAAMISLVKLRLLNCDSDFSLRGHTLRAAIEEDLEKGLIPFYVCGTFGTTGCCSFDNVLEMGPICQEYDAYLHVDAAYAGNALICSELRGLMLGIENVDSFSCNPNKWMLINFDSSCLWVKDKYTLTRALSTDPVYLQYGQMEKAIDYRNWGISLSRRFRSLKLWFTIRSYGVEGLQNYIRQHAKLAKEFEELMLTDKRFEIFGKVTLGLVCFRMKGPELLSKNLLFQLNDSGKIHMTPAIICNKYILRFSVNSKKAASADIRAAYEIIAAAASDVLREHAASGYESPAQVQLRRRNHMFATIMSSAMDRKRPQSFDGGEQASAKKGGDPRRARLQKAYSVVINDENL